ncbi:hypothetical protein ACF1HJ_11735 [Streptomyces sp. NPDC013978]|uniref:rhamnogalacturonan lyase family protein n=1 Tax=Streptomyces sp. NPDC013978 TaxID=3364869 RepID=UPI0036F589E8
MLGDWREEAVHTNASHDELIVFTTDRPTATRLCTPAHNPATATPWPSRAICSPTTSTTSSAPA